MLCVAWGWWRCLIRLVVGLWSPKGRWQKAPQTTSSSKYKPTHCYPRETGTTTVRPSSKGTLKAPPFQNEKGGVPEIASKLPGHLRSHPQLAGSSPRELSNAARSRTLAPACSAAIHYPRVQRRHARVVRTRRRILPGPTPVAHTRSRLRLSHPPSACAVPTKLIMLSIASSSTSPQPLISLRA